MQVVPSHHVSIGKHPQMLPIALACLYTGNLLFALAGYSLADELWNAIRSGLGYLIPSAIWLALKCTTPFPAKKLISRFVFVIASLSVLGLFVDLWMGSLNFRKTAMHFEPNATYRSDFGTWHYILQKVRYQDTTIILEVTTLEDLDHTRYHELTYVKTIGPFFQNTKRVCEIQGSKSVSFEIDPKREILTINAIGKAEKSRPIRHEFSIDISKVKMKFFEM